MFYKNTCSINKSLQLLGKCGAGGYYDWAKNGYGDSQMRGGINGLMVVNSAGGDTAKSTVLHELQHAIQQKEGFARGGSPQTVNQSIFRENQAKYFDDLITQLEEKLPKPNQQWIDDIHDPIEAQIEKIKEQKEKLAHSTVDYKDARTLKENSDEKRLLQEWSSIWVNQL